MDMAYVQRERAVIRQKLDRFQAALREQEAAEARAEACLRDIARLRREVQDIARLRQEVQDIGSAVAVEAAALLAQVERGEIERAS